MREMWAALSTFRATYLEALFISLIGAIIAGLFAPINVILVVFWALLVAADAWVGLRRLRRQGGGRPSHAIFFRGLMRKVAWGGMIVVAAVLGALASMLPALGPLMLTVTPFTKMTVLVLIIYEYESIARNLGHGGPADLFTGGKE